MIEVAAPEVSMTDVVLHELRKVPDRVIEMLAGNHDLKEHMVQAIGEALVIVEKHMDISYQEESEADLASDKGSKTKVYYTESVDNLAQQYWDLVSTKE